MEPQEYDCCYFETKRKCRKISCLGIVAKILDILLILTIIMLICKKDKKC